MKTIAIANQKGGCGKTTSAVNIATAFARLGKHVLIIDLDPQGHATLGLGYNANSLEKTIYDSLTNNNIPITKIIIKSNEKNLDLVPSNILLSGVELELASFYSREFILAQQIGYIENDYDICVIDCSPSLSLLTLNALVASTDVLIPVQAQYYAIEGLKQLLETIDIVKQRFNHRLKILGALLTFIERRTTLSKQIERQMREYFGDMVFDTVIQKTVRLAEAPSAGLSIFSYAPKSSAATEYMALAKEILYGKAESIPEYNDFHDTYKADHKLLAEETSNV